MAETDWEILTQLIGDAPPIPEDTKNKLGETTVSWRQAVVNALLRLQRDAHVDFLNINRRADELIASYCSITRTANQDIAPGGMRTIQYDTVVSDADDLADIANYAIGIVRPGWYLVTLRVGVTMPANSAESTFFSAIETDWDYMYGPRIACGGNFIDIDTHYSIPVYFDCVGSNNWVKGLVRHDSGGNAAIHVDWDIGILSILGPIGL